ncbi:SagB family peptide dehydrogenase [Pseudomonas sp. R5(2019)]|uniref:SagB family peptide dehydrogenase n=1 Tax=Pseudomonas sp. R5(2019) TaxID=2697566 RepID=UPI0014129B4D|nr:SagB family peptide dehydrogenase [Pseudomonas sp. R5(2019)]NBA94049.1 SagB/ThcOx family dehydrogenase [Pseudomonas sp. R5(2019)]
MKVNSNCFFLARPPALIYWCYETHEQIELTGPYLERLVELISGTATYSAKNAIDREFADRGILCQSDEQAWGWDELSKIFHIGTKNIPYSNVPETAESWATAYLEHCNEVLSSSPPIENYEVQSQNQENIALPPICPQPLSKVLLKRKTSRNFQKKCVPLTEISNLLHYSLGFLEERMLQADTGLPENLCHRRSSPSGGGLNATEGYLYVKNVDGLNAGFYYYNPLNHTLTVTSAESKSTLGELLSGQHFSDDLAFGIFLTSRLDKLWWKYEHSRAYRMAFVEIGHISQTFQLLATETGLSTWLTGALDENKIEPLLNIKNPGEQVLFFIGAGTSTGGHIPDALDQLIKRP